MKVPVYTYECDSCHKPCKHGDFIIPYHERVPVEARGGKNNEVLMRLFEDKIYDTPVDLCDQCREKIAYMVKLIPNMKLDKDGNISISANGGE